MTLRGTNSEGLYFASSSQRSVGDPSDRYSSLRPLWERSRAVIQGQRFAKQYDYYVDTINFNNLLLPFSANMSQRQYDFYRAEAELPGLTSQYARALVGGMLRKGVSLQLPEDAPEGSKEWIIHNFTADNRSLHSFLNDALWEEVQTSRAWILIDYPVINRELTVEEQKSVKPYPVLLKAESIINWRAGTDPITGSSVLTSLITRSYTEKFEDNEFHPKYIDTVTVYDINQGYLRVRKYEYETPDGDVPIINGELQQFYDVTGGGSRKGSETKWKLISTNENVFLNGERMTMIPAFPFNGRIEADEPTLQPLIDREIGLYNKISRRNHLLYGAATYTPVVASDMSDEEFEDLVNTGLGSWLRVRHEEKITALETPTQALSDMETAIKSTIEEMARMGIRLLNPEGNSGTSGISLEIRNSAQTGQLANLNAQVSAMMQKVIAFMMNWRYGTNYSSADIDFSLSGDFNPAPLGEGYLRLVSEWYQAGLISRSVFLEIAKQNDIIPSNYDDKEGMQEIMEDDLIVPVREQFDVSNALKESKEMASGDLPEFRERNKVYDDGSGSPER